MILNRMLSYRRGRCLSARTRSSSRLTISINQTVLLLVVVTTTSIVTTTLIVITTTSVATTTTIMIQPIYTIAILTTISLNSSASASPL